MSPTRYMADAAHNESSPTTQVRDPAAEGSKAGHLAVAGRPAWSSFPRQARRPSSECTAGRSGMRTRARPRRISIPASGCRRRSAPGARPVRRREQSDRSGRTGQRPPRAAQGRIATLILSSTRPAVITRWLRPDAGNRPSAHWSSTNYCGHRPRRQRLGDGKEPRWPALRPGLRTASKAGAPGRPIAARKRIRP